MKIISLSILIVIVLSACSKKKLEITNEYIINENWTKKNEKALANSITINKMKLKKDSTIDPFIELKQSEILSKLEEDTAFMHYANIKIKEGSYKSHKIYFNRDNGFYWGSKSRNKSEDTTKTIGLLLPGWYAFSDLGLLTYSSVYVYIDSLNKVHQFNITAENY